MTASAEIVAVIGAGHGGKAMAAYLAVQGWTVHLYNRTAAHRGARLRGGSSWSARTAATLSAPAVSRLTRPRPWRGPDRAGGGAVLRPPGSRPGLRPAPARRPGGAAQSGAHRRGAGVPPRPAPGRLRRPLRRGGGPTFIFASRSNGPAEAKIFRVKNAIPVAPCRRRTPPAHGRPQPRLPPVRPRPERPAHQPGQHGGHLPPRPDHPQRRAHRVHRGNYQFYVEGLTPSIARVLESRTGSGSPSPPPWACAPPRPWMAGVAAYATGSSLYEAMLNNPGYHGITAPVNLEHRYIFEDVPMSLVPIAELGHAFGVATPGHRHHGAPGLHHPRRQLPRRGRTLERLGLAGMTLDEVQRYVETGDGIATPGSATESTTPPARSALAFPWESPVRLTPLRRPDRPSWWTSAAPSPSCSWSTRRRGRSWPGLTAPPPWAKAWRWACGRGWPTSPSTPAPAPPSSSAGPAPASPAAALLGGAWWPWASSAS